MISRDISDANVLLQADGDDIDSAALIDWDLSSFPPDGEWDDDIVRIYLVCFHALLCADYFTGGGLPEGH